MAVPRVRGSYNPRVCGNLSSILAIAHCDSLPDCIIREKFVITLSQDEHRYDAVQSGSAMITASDCVYIT